MNPRFYWGFRFTSHGIRPYAGVRMGGWSLGKHQATHVQKIIYHCSRCNAINDRSARYCNKCGAAFSS